jgi:hypothetical protein
MINSLLGMLFGCSHKRTSFPLTPLQRSRLSSKTSEAARRGTYVACLDCGKEFDYNWKEMRVGSPVKAIPASLSALKAGQTVAH